ncbi:MAG: hypothetical protein ACKODH_11095 [Limisphaerales bacterium]
MFTYLFPIFAFGLVITGVVFLGLQQASDWAKDLAAQNSKMEPSFKNQEVVPPGRNSTPLNPPANVTQK